MSLFWDPRAKRPQLWTYGFFIVLTLGLCYLAYLYGAKKSSEKTSVSSEKDIK